MLFFVASFASLLLLLWVVGRIWGDSPILAIASFFFWPAMFYAVIKYWGEEERDIKVPFLLFLVVTGYVWYEWFKILAPAEPHEEAMLMQVLRLLA